MTSRRDPNLFFGRPVQESINIIETMLAQASYFGNYSEIEYWEKRLHGTLKWAQSKGIKVSSKFSDRNPSTGESKQ